MISNLEENYSRFWLLLLTLQHPKISQGGYFSLKRAASLSTEHSGQRLGMSDVRCITWGVIVHTPLICATNLWELHLTFTCCQFEWKISEKIKFEYVRFHIIVFVKNFGEAVSQLMCEKSMLKKFDFTPLYICICICICICISSFNECARKVS